MVRLICYINAAWVGEIFSRVLEVWENRCLRVSLSLTWSLVRSCSSTTNRSSSTSTKYIISDNTQHFHYTYECFNNFGKTLPSVPGDFLFSTTKLGILCCFLSSLAWTTGKMLRILGPWNCFYRLVEWDVFENCSCTKGHPQLIALNSCQT